MEALRHRPGRVDRLYLLPGLGDGLKAAAISVVLAAVFGMLFGVGRLVPGRAVRWMSSVVVEFFRAVPVLLMMVFVFFGLFATATWLPNQYAPLAAVVPGSPSTTAR